MLCRQQGRWEMGLELGTCRKIATESWQVSKVNGEGTFGALKSRFVAVEMNRFVCVSNLQADAPPTKTGTVLTPGGF